MTMLRAKTFVFYSDPGHGWLKVSIRLLIGLGIASQISGCSYQRGEWAYLEEDGDMWMFLNALTKLGIPHKRKKIWTNKQSKIRKYKCYDHAAVSDFIGA